MSVKKIVVEKTLEYIKLSQVWFEYEVDQETVDGLEISIQNDQLPDPPQVWKSQREDGTPCYRVIDGNHRLRALLAQGIEEYPVDIVDCNDRIGCMRRIAATLGKKSDLIVRRALQEIRELFSDDLMALLDTAQIYEHTYNEEGEEEIRLRTTPLPQNPVELLIALYDHREAKSEPTEAWEKYIEDWLTNVSQRLNKTTAWLRDEVLGVTILTASEMRGDNPAYRARLLSHVRDQQIRAVLMGRIKHDRPRNMELRQALNYLGCGPDRGPKRQPVSWIRSQLGSKSIQQLAKAYEAWDTQERLKEQARLEQARMAKIAQALQPVTPPSNMPSTPLERAVNTTPNHAPATRYTPLPSSADFRPDAEERENKGDQVNPSLVFGIVGEKHAAKVTVLPKKPAQPTESSKPSFAGIRYLIKHLMEKWDEFDQQGGDWSDPEIQKNMVELVLRAQEYIILNGQQRGRIS